MKAIDYLRNTLNNDPDEAEQQRQMDTQNPVLQQAQASKKALAQHKQGILNGLSAPQQQGM